MTTSRPFVGDVSEIATTWSVRIRRDALVEVDESMACQFTIRGFSRSIGRLSAGTAAAIRAMAERSVQEGRLSETVMTIDGPAGLARWISSLKALDAAGFVEWEADLDGAFLARLRPMGMGPSPTAPELGLRSHVRLDRFAMAHAESGCLMVHSPRSHLVVDLGTKAAAILATIAGWVAVDDVAGRLDAVPSTAVGAVLSLLMRAAALEQAFPEQDAADETIEVEGVAEEKGESQALAGWDPFDLWVHARTRGPQLVAGWGNTYPLRDRFSPLPGLPPRRCGVVVSLRVPDLVAAAGNEPPFVTVMETRRSVRDHDEQRPITVDQLGELLYRSARTRKVVDTADGLDQMLDRPYPSGGAMHELEIYPVVRRCDGLAAGLWHYRSDDHSLEQLSGFTYEVEGLIEASRIAALMNESPQVLLTISARFGRINWKYETIAYALVLKHVGVLIQNLYLVASAMGLAPCAIGAGDGASFATASGLDPLAEGSVGEFMVGSRPAELRHTTLNDWKA